MTEYNETAANEDVQTDCPTLAEYDEGDRIDPQTVDRSTDSARYHTVRDAPEDRIAVVHQRENFGKLIAVLYDTRTDLYAVVTARTDRHVRGCSHAEYRIKSIGSEIRADVTAISGEFDDEEDKEWLETEAPAETVHGNHDWYYADDSYERYEYSVYDHDGRYPSMFEMRFVAQ